MKRNVGNFDRTIRIAIGLGLLSWLLLVPGPARWWGLVGLIPLATGVLAWCPAYVVLGLGKRGGR